MELMLWILIIIVYVIIKMSKAAGRNNVRGTQKSNVPRPNTPVRNPQRSFAAVPKQQKAIPNVERNCSADDKHRFENNISGHKVKKTSAVPNVQTTRMHPQPKKSGNRRVAGRLYEGDPIPQGARMVKCGYCAAENLVPYTARNEYKCYFCHYDI